MPLQSGKMIRDLLTELKYDSEFTRLFWIYGIFFFIQLYYVWLVFARTFFRKPFRQSTDAPPVSVIITVNNQYQDLRDHLPEFLNQSYPLYEVVAVDTGSDDGTVELLERFTELYPHLKVVHLPGTLNWFRGNKFPLSIGIKSARHDVILISDIRFKPVGYHWIRDMVKEFNPPVEIVLGHVSWQTGSIFNYWYRFVAFYRSLFVFSLARTGFPVEGFSPNLLFSRRLFYQNKGFTSHYTITPGAGELFVNRAGNARNTAPALSASARMTYDRKMTITQWFRHFYEKLTIERYYHPISKFFERLYEYSLLGFWISLIILLDMALFWPVVLAIFLIRLVSQWIIFGKAQKRLGEPYMWIFSPLLEPLFLLLKIMLRLQISSTRRKTWL